MASYHHRELRDGILAAAVDVIARDGVGALSLRAVAKDLGVSHTAFRRHFGSREGVLNALAAAGHRMLADRLTAATAGGTFADIGVAYVRFALEHPGHFTVMFRSDLLDRSDPELAAARAATLAPLRADHLAGPTAGEVTRWGLVHGIATLALTGNLDPAADVPDLTRRALAIVHPSERK